MFIRLNLTTPYWGTVSELTSVPPLKEGPEGRGDATDWAIFMFILALTLFGFVVMVHQVGIIIDKRLRFRHIFHPTTNEADEDDWAALDREGSPMKHGGGFSHSELRMTTESIPLSMGGREGSPRSPPTVYHDDPNEGAAANNNGLDLEMAERRTTPPHSRQDSFTSPTLFQEQGLVERPSLRSTSKIALPKTPSPVAQEDKKRRVKLRDATPPPLPHKM